MGADEDFAERLAEQRRLLAEIRENATGAPPMSSDIVTTGASADGRVSVRVRSGRVESVSINGSRRIDLGEVIATAVNAALTEFRARAPSAGDPLPDLDALGEQLREVEQRGIQLMRMIHAALDEVMTKVGPRTGMRGDASPNHVDFLFNDTSEALRSARDHISGLAGPRITGTGRDEDERVRATVDRRGLVSRLELTAADDSRLVDVAMSARAAINTALDDWDRRRGDAPSAAVEDARRLAARTAALREHSMKHLRGYTRNLNAIMNSVEKPG